MPNDRPYTESFSVIQFFRDPDLVGMEYEYVRQYVGVQEAVEAFKHYTHNVATMLGMVNRVIIIDGGNNINAEWVLGQGLVFPTPEMMGMDTNEQGEQENGN
jgi:hypothetical protein